MANEMATSTVLEKNMIEKDRQRRRRVRIAKDGEGTYSGKKKIEKKERQWRRTKKTRVQFSVTLCRQIQTNTLNNVQICVSKQLAKQPNPHLLRTSSPVQHSP